MFAGLAEMKYGQFYKSQKGWGWGCYFPPAEQLSLPSSSPVCLWTPTLSLLCTGLILGPFHQLPMVSRPPPALPLWAGRRSPQHSELKANSLKQRSEGLGVELLFIMPRGHCVIYGQVWRQVGAQTWVWAQCECRDREIDSWIDEDKLLGQQGWRLESSYRCELC